MLLDGGALTQFPISTKLKIEVSENDIIFCNPNFKEIEVAKNGIGFSYFIFFENEELSFAIHRDSYGDKFVSENDVIFCNFNFKEIGIAKNGIVFPILKELNWRPAAASGKFAPAGEQQLFIFVDV